jgi:hypothetical protein
MCLNHVDIHFLQQFLQQPLQDCQQTVTVRNYIIILMIIHNNVKY